MSFEKLEQEHNLINRLLIASGVSPVSADFNIIKLHSLLEMFYEHAFIEGMAKQAQSSVDRAVNGMYDKLTVKFGEKAKEYLESGKKSWQPEQEPSTIQIKDGKLSYIKKPWVGLTDEEIRAVCSKSWNALSLCQLVEQALLEKNNAV